MATLLNRIAYLQEELSTQAGIDPQTDRFKSGAINAYRDMLNIDFEETLADA